MDPIHPIVPTAPGLAPIAPAPAVTPTDRQIERRRREEERERRRRRERGDSYNDQESPSDDDDAGEDDGRLHVDVIV